MIATDTKLNLLDAFGKVELLAALGRVDISVPGHNRGRAKSQRETWTICRLLATLAFSERLEYPLSVFSNERPDFLAASGAMKIGIEVTEASSQQFQQYASLGAREFPDALLEPAHFRPGTPERTPAQMRELLSQTRLTSGGWSGESAEHDWAFFVERAIADKRDGLGKPGFKTFDRNWLAIYENAPLPAIDLGRAIEFLSSRLAGSWSRARDFDSIFVETGATIVRVTATETECLELCDLWSPKV